MGKSEKQIEKEKARNQRIMVCSLLGRQLKK